MTDINKSGLRSAKKKRRKLSDIEILDTDNLNPDKKGVHVLSDSKEQLTRTNMELPKSDYISLKTYCMSNKVNLKDKVYQYIKEGMIKDKII